MPIRNINPERQDPSVDQVFSRNATKVNIALRLPGGKWKRVGRVQSFSQDIANNVQVLTELGSQFAVELKKGITIFTFQIAKFYVHSDVFDQLRGGGIFGLEIKDYSNVNGPRRGHFTGGRVTGHGRVALLERFSQCSLTSVSRQYSSGQATVAQNASVVTIGPGHGRPD